MCFSLGRGVSGLALRDTFSGVMLAHPRVPRDLEEGDGAHSNWPLSCDFPGCFCFSLGCYWELGALSGAQTVPREGGGRPAIPKWVTPLSAFQVQQAVPVSEGPGSGAGA